MNLSDRDLHASAARRPPSDDGPCLQVRSARLDCLSEMRSRATPCSGTATGLGWILHFAARNAPFRRIQIKLHTLCLTQLTRSHPYQRRQLEGFYGQRVTAIPVDIEQQ